MSDHDYTLKVLIVDDDEDVRDPLAEWMELVEGMVVDTARNGKEALDLVKRDDGRYDVVLLDKNLEDEDGIDVMRQIHAESPDLPVIMFTGQDHAAGAEAKEAGAYDYLLKPFEDDDLVDLIREAAEQNISAQDAILSQTAKRVRQSLSVPVCLVWLLDRAKGKFKVTAWAGDVGQDYRNSVYIDWENAAPRRFPGRGRTAYFSDLREQEIWETLQYRDAMIKQGWVSLLSAPMVIEGRTIGVIDVCTLEKRAFEDEEREGLGDEASQAAISVRSAQLAARARALFDITQKITGGVDVSEEELFESILERGLELVGTEIGWLYLVDRATNSLRIKSSRGIEEEEAGITRQVGEGITGWVAEHGIPQNVPDVERDPRYFHGQGQRIRSEIVVPLRRGLHIVGVLTAKSPFPNAFSADDLYLLSTFASLAVVAVENSRLLQRGMGLPDLLHKIDEHIASASNSGEILQQIVNDAVKLTDATSGIIYLVNEDGESIAKSFQYPPSCKQPKPQIDREEGFFSQIVETGQAQFISNARDDTRVSPVLRDQIEALIAVPLKLEQKTIGILSVTQQEDYLTNADVSLLLNLANRAEKVLGANIHSKQTPGQVEQS